jgi:hypothetical protein
MLPAEIVFCIVETDILYHLADPLNVIGQFSIFHFLAKQVTQQSPEIFMAGKREETTAVR